MPLAKNNDEETGMRAICAVLLLAAGAVQAATTGLLARDINGDGTVDAYYDPAQGVSFAADANLAGTQGFFVMPSAPGAFEQQGAIQWAQALNFYGVTGWRLAHVTAYQCDDSDRCMPTSSELSVLPTYSVFSNVIGKGFWLDAFVPGEATWGHLVNFDTAYGLHITDEGGALALAWAVHDGDVSAKAQPAGDPPPIPEPSSWALVLGGLVVMGTLSRRRTSAPASSARRSKRRARTLPGQWVMQHA